MKNIDLSFIIPVYNTEKWLVATLESCLAQQHPEINLEYILIDDGSTDGSELILSDFAKRHANAILLKQKNRGPGNARNEGIKLASGRYIWFVDSDDKLIANKAYSLLKNTDLYRPEIVAFKSVSKNQKLGPLPKWRYPTGISNTRTVLITRTYYVSICSHLFNREWLIENSIFLPKLDRFEDNLFMLTCLSTEGSILAIDEVCYEVHPRENSNSRSEYAEIANGMFPALEATNHLLDRHTANKPITNAIRNHMAGDIGLLLFKARKSQEVFTRCCNRIKTSPQLKNVLRTADTIQYRSIGYFVSFPFILRQLIKLWHLNRVD